MKRVLFNILLILALMLAFTATAFAQDGAPERFEGRDLPDLVAELKLDTPVELSGLSGSALDSSLVGAEGENRVVIRLSADFRRRCLCKRR